MFIVSLNVFDMRTVNKYLLLHYLMLITDSYFEERPKMMIDFCENHQNPNESENSGNSYGESLICLHVLGVF